MTVEYGRDGIIGVLTPQANTTVEPECAILLPPGLAMIAARLTSTKASMDDRMVDYVDALDGILDQFANAPLDAVAFACTGSSYAIGAEREARMVARIGGARNYPFVTAGDAITDALDALGARSMAMVSPYGDRMHRSALDYWRERGFAVRGVARLTSSETEFHPIYTLTSDSAAAGVRDVSGAADAVVLLGTGMPTLAAILNTGSVEQPVLSSNLCLMWRATLAARGEAPTAASLGPWLDGSFWRQRFELQAA